MLTTAILLVFLQTSCPVVDIEADPIPVKTARDAFGRRVGEQYIAFNVLVSNPCKYEFRIQSLKILSGAASYSPIPMVQALAVAEKGRSLDRRNIWRRALKVIALAGGAIVGLPGGEKYSQIVALVAGPGSQAFDIMLPDHTLGQVERLTLSGFDGLTVEPFGQLAGVMFVDALSLLDPGELKAFRKHGPKSAGLHLISGEALGGYRMEVVP